MLIADNISSYYGNIQALDSVSIEVNKGEIVSIIGSNGAGKSTLLMTLCGIVPAKTGSIYFNNTEISSLPTHEIIRMGVSQSPEGRRIFPKLTVYENLLIGDPQKKEKEINLDFVFEIFPRLKERINQRGGTLSGGEQQMLSIGRALVSQPSLLLLDEPSLGLAPIIVKQIFETIKRINRENKTTILLVEQNAFGALKLSDRGYVLVNGKVTISGDSKQLLENSEIKKAYLELNSLLKFIKDEHQISILLIEHDMSVVMGISDKVVVLDYGKKIAEGMPNEVKGNPEVIKAYLGEE